MCCKKSMVANFEQRCLRGMVLAIGRLVAWHKLVHIQVGRKLERDDSFQRIGDERKV